LFEEGVQKAIFGPFFSSYFPQMKSSKKKALKKQQYRG
jgi:hypothetical protein